MPSFSRRYYLAYAVRHPPENEVFRQDSPFQKLPKDISDFSFSRFLVALQTGSLDPRILPLSAGRSLPFLLR